MARHHQQRRIVDESESQGPTNTKIVSKQYRTAAVKWQQTLILTVKSFPQKTTKDNLTKSTSNKDLQLLKLESDANVKMWWMEQQN